MVDSSTLHRGAKYFMDSGRAATHDKAMAILQSFGLTIQVGPSIATSRDEQVALLTLVNAARRSFLAGVTVVGLPIDAKPLTRLTRAINLARAVKELGGTGRTHDWSLSRAIRERVNVPLFLAGGLIAENVGQAIREVGPFALDVCSGVRTDGKLDREKLARFFSAVWNVG